jgi:hypothetical protein
MPVLLGESHPRSSYIIQNLTSERKITIDILGGSSCGPTFYDYPYQWPGGANGYFYLKFPVAVATWTVTVQFSSSVNGLSVWNGANINCAGSTCTFTDAGYNANQAIGASLTLGFQVKLFGLKNIFFFYL